jgi:hypothetical protein
MYNNTLKRPERELGKRYMGSRIFSLWYLSKIVFCKPFLELVMLLVVALVIVKEALGAEALLEEDYDIHPYLPKFIRLIINLTAVVMGDHGELLDELEEVLDTDSRTKKIVESGYELIPSDQMPKRMVNLILYLCNVAICSEQTYKEIFYGTYAPMVFWEDLRAAKWWMP